MDLAPSDASDAELSKAYVRMWTGAGDASCAWASDELDDLVLQNPDRVWRIILQILASNPPREVRAILAAGPLESLLRAHAIDFIDRVEAQAAGSQPFRAILSGVDPMVCRSAAFSRRLSCAMASPSLR
ncbi:MAG: DUF6869 domain-containing protein [Prosthecobacter sp.]